MKQTQALEQSAPFTALLERLEDFLDDIYEATTQAGRGEPPFLLYRPMARLLDYSDTAILAPPEAKLLKERHREIYLDYLGHLRGEVSARLKDRAQSGSAPFHRLQRDAIKARLALAKLEAYARFPIGISGASIRETLGSLEVLFAPATITPIRAALDH
jgi:hypothetical protein